MAEGEMEAHDGWDASDRRQFIKRVAITSAFAVPVVTSFSMTGLSISSASAQTSNLSFVSNQSPPS
jgi:hypothetical protein